VPGKTKPPPPEFCTVAAIVALIAAVLVSFAAAVLGSWAMLEAILRLAEIDGQRMKGPTENAPGEIPALDVRQPSHGSVRPTYTSLPRDLHPSDDRMGLDDPRRAAVEEPEPN
jgi:hypothetical protein